jgi:predicted nucleotidyltransferase
VVTNPKTLKDIIDGYTTPEEEEAWKMKADEIQIGGTHYKDMGVEPWEVMKAVLTPEEFIGFLKGNIIKYAMRQGRKDSDDAAKCKHYLKKLREVEERF